MLTREEPKQPIGKENPVKRSETNIVLNPQKAGDPQQPTALFLDNPQPNKYIYQDTSFRVLPIVPTGDANIPYAAATVGDLKKVNTICLYSTFPATEQGDAPIALKSGIQSADQGDGNLTLSGSEIYLGNVDATILWERALKGRQS